jgi:hypothetical protein
MNIVDLLVTIVVVTILVTIILAVVTYVASKLRLSREPASSDADSGPQYFVLYPPPTLPAGRPPASSITGTGQDAVPEPTAETHAAQA